jgi:CRP-like cAMP-binding protein
MQNPLVLKLDRACGLDAALHSLLDFGPSRLVGAHVDIVGDGSEVSHTGLLVRGLACRYKILGGGRRAILGFLVPGDFTNLPFPDRQRLDFGVTALTGCEVVDVSCAHLRELASASPRLGAALWALIQMDQAILLRWLTQVGQCPADKRLAHLLCELRERLALVGLADDHSFRLPLTQEELGDALGLSTVHVNRVLQHLRELSMIRTADRTVSIPELGRFETFAEFDPAYLHLRSAVTPASDFHTIA